MPKTVDHQKQRQMIAEATWRVIMRDGIEKATVRNIAKEAGISAGSLRHYFSSQSELLAFSMQLVSDRVKERMMAAPLSGTPLEGIKRLLLEVLPLTDETRSEMEVWLAFTQKALWDKELQPLSKRMYDELRAAMKQMIELFIRLGIAKPDLSVELETDRLYALVDGLAMHAIMRPDQLSSEHIEAIIDYHLQSLCR